MSFNEETHTHTHTHKKKKKKKKKKKTSSPKGNDRSPESQHVIKIILATSQVSKIFFSEVQEQLTPQSMV